MCKKCNDCIAHWAYVKSFYEAYVKALLSCPWRRCSSENEEDDNVSLPMLTKK